MALFPVIDGQVQFDLSVPSGSIYRNGLRYSPDGAVFAALDGQVSNYSQGVGLTADGAVVITGGAGIIGWQNGLPRDVESGAVFVTVGDALTYASGLPFTAQGALAISSDAPVPTLDLQFAGATMLDPSVDFTRGSEATGWVNGQLKTFGIDEPRFVTDPATGYSGLLLEPQSTNLLLNSEVVVDQTIIVPSGDITLSFYGEGEVSFTGAATGTLQGAGGNARAAITVTAAAGALVLSVADGSPSLGQLEEGTKATSYIPTEVSQVTRAADNFSIVGQGFDEAFNPAQGALVFKIGEGSLLKRVASIPPYYALALSTGDDVSAVAFKGVFFSSLTAGYIANVYVAATGPTLHSVITENIPPGNTVCISWNVDEIALAVDGVMVDRVTDPDLPAALAGADGFRINAALGTELPYLKMYGRALTDAQMESLTEASQ